MPILPSVGRHHRHLRNIRDRAPRSGKMAFVSHEVEGRNPREPAKQVGRERHLDICALTCTAFNVIGETRLNQSLPTRQGSHSRLVKRHFPRSQHAAYGNAKNMDNPTNRHYQSSLLTSFFFRDINHDAKYTYRFRSIAQAFQAWFAAFASIHASTSPLAARFARHASAIRAAHRSARAEKGCDAREVVLRFAHQKSFRDDYLHVLPPARRRPEPRPRRIRLYHAAPSPATRAPPSARAKKPAGASVYACASFAYRGFCAIIFK